MELIEFKKLIKRSFLGVFPEIYYSLQDSKELKWKIFFYSSTFKRINVGEIVRRNNKFELISLRIKLAREIKREYTFLEEVGGEIIKASFGAKLQNEAREKLKKAKTNNLVLAITELKQPYNIVVSTPIEGLEEGKNLISSHIKNNGTNYTFRIYYGHWYEKGYQLISHKKLEELIII